MNFLNKDIPVIVISSSSFIFLLFLITIIFKIELIITIMFVMPITVVSTSGMVLSYKHKQMEDARSERMRSISKKYMKQVNHTTKQITSKTRSQKSIPKPLPPKRLPMKVKKKIKKDPKKKKTLELINQKLDTKELEELRQTESEVDIEKQKFTCIVHKGPIEGNLYLCPHCKTFYCAKCAKALKEKGEECWSCGKELETTKKISQEMQKQISTLNSLISHYKIRLNTLDMRFRAKAIDKLPYYEEKESLTEKLNRYVESLSKLKKTYLNYD